MDAKKLSRTELAKEFFGIAPKTFSNGTEKYLSYLSEYYEWHMEGRAYVLDKELKPWEPPKFGRRPSTRAKVQADYTKAMHEIVDNDPAQKLNSGANLTRNAREKNPNQICTTYNHRDDTMSRYFCQSIKEEFPMSERVWVKRKNDLEYEELSEEEQKYLFMLIENNFHQKVITPQELAETYFLYQQKDITKSEALSLLVGDIDDLDPFYKNVLRGFKKKFGFIPIRAKRLEASAF